MLKPNYSVDYAQLENKLLKRAYKLSEVKDQLQSVAFDVVRFKDNDKGANLWQIQSADDGDYIVAIYEDEAENTKTASSPWEVILSKTSNTLNFFYKGAPILKMSAKQLGIPASELALAEQYLPAKLADNAALVSSLLQQLPAATKQEVLSQYPELNGVK
jgi:hypothetical protein